MLDTMENGVINKIEEKYSIKKRDLYKVFKDYFFLFNDSSKISMSILQHIFEELLRKLENKIQISDKFY